MKKPEKPKDWNKILEKSGGEIFKLLDNKKVNQLITKYNQKYIHWEQLKYKKIPEKTTHEGIWALMKIFRKSRYRFIKFGKGYFKYSLLDDSLKKIHFLDKGSAGNLETGLETINVEGRDRFIISSLMEEAIASSQLEGAATTRRVAKEMLRLRKKPKNYSEKMIINGYKTMQSVLSLKDEDITPKMILKLHREITNDTLKDKNEEGHFRKNNDIVVADPLDIEKVYHVPPDFKELNSLIKEFCEFANKKNGEFIHPIIKGIILHFLIGYIHPFNDGNGRTARTIFYWYVLRQDYWLFEFMAISRILLRSKVKYGLAYLYTETDENDLTYFINYNLSAIEEALCEMQKHIAKKQREQAEALKLIKSIKNINLRQAEILKEFIKNPSKSFVINEIISTYGIAYDTARNDLLHLTKIGKLEKIKLQKKYIFKLKRD